MAVTDDVLQDIDEIFELLTLRVALLPILYSSWREERRVDARKMQITEIDEHTYTPQHSPTIVEYRMWYSSPISFLDYKLFEPDLCSLVMPLLEKDWLKGDLEGSARAYVVQHLASNPLVGTRL